MPKAAKPAPKNGNAGSALTRALRFEKTGMRYFALSEQKATDGFAKRVFALLADMERKHYEEIQAIAKKVGEDGRFPAVSAVNSEGRMRLFKREYSRIKKEKTITGTPRWRCGRPSGSRPRGGRCTPACPPTPRTGRRRRSSNTLPSRSRSISTSSTNTSNSSTTRGCGCRTGKESR